jgi:YfiH family protein
VAWQVARWAAVPGLEQRFGDRSDVPPPGVTTLRQVHGRHVFDVSEVDAGAAGDALITRQAQALVGVWTADCVPVHLLARQAGVAAAVHCGWRGTALGIVAAALQTLQRRYDVAPADVEAALGPAIGGCCYEVGEEVREVFRTNAPVSDAGFTVRDGRLFLDLRVFLAAQLGDLGIAYAETVGPCTACRTDLLFSYRKQGSTGRQLSWIGWR